ncbi:MAG: flagellar motor protein [bacterium]|jgi:chemotaxis protein MotA
MDIATIAGLILCFVGFLGGFVMEGGHLTSLVQLSAGAIVFGGTFGAGIASAALSQTTGIAGILKHAFVRKERDPQETIATFVKFAEKARREGLLVLEEDVRELKDRFLQNGVQLVIDGTDTELVKDILQTELAYIEERHETGAKYFENLGGFAPTFGIIGTVMGLVHVLSNLSDPSSLGPAISAAFIATLYGVVSANAIFLPIANKLKSSSKEEILIMELMIEGILSIQAGDNPRIVKEKLNAFLPPARREKEEAKA